MTPTDLLLKAIDPAIAFLATQGVNSDDRARVLLLTIAGQEADWIARRQIGCYTPGTFQTIGARGFWQCERMGAVAEAMSACPIQLKVVCTALEVPFNLYDLYEGIAWHDVLAASIARLTLWPDPAPLPALGDVQGSWAYYQRNWRPGAPHPDVWPAKYGTAMGIVKANPAKG